MRALWVGTACSLLIGCAAGSGPARSVAGSDCVFHSTISGFQALDDRRLIIFGSGRRDAYLAELAGSCFDVEYRATLALIDRDGDGRFCGYGRDGIAYRSGSRLESCRVLSLQRLEPAERDKLLARPGEKDQLPPEDE